MIHVHSFRDPNSDFDFLYSSEAGSNAHAYDDHHDDAKPIIKQSIRAC